MNKKEFSGESLPRNLPVERETLEDIDVISEVSESIFNSPAQERHLRLPRSLSEMSVNTDQKIIKNKAGRVNLADMRLAK